MPNAQHNAVNAHRRRRRESGVVRVELQALAIDAPVLRDLAAILRRNAGDAQITRDQLRALITKPRVESAFDIFGSDLPDAYFEGVFDHAKRDDLPRDVEL